MKNFIIILALLIASGFEVYSQNTETDHREKFTFGLRAGMNYSNVYDTKGEEFRADAKFGLAGGLVAAIPIGKFFGVQPELLISQKGFRASGVLLGSSYNFTRTTTYVDIPLQFAVKPGEFFTIVLGPQYSYLLTSKDEFTNSSSSYSQEQEFKNDNIRKNLFGVVGGIDINLKHIVVGARVGWDIQQNNGDGTSVTPRYKNVWYQATVGYRFYSNN